MVLSVSGLSVSTHKKYLDEIITYLLKSSLSVEKLFFFSSFEFGQKLDVFSLTAQNLSYMYHLKIMVLERQIF